MQVKKTKDKWVDYHIFPLLKVASQIFFLNIILIWLMPIERKNHEK